MAFAASKSYLKQCVSDCKSHFVRVMLNAQEEMKLEKDIAKIESCWRQQTVETATYKNVPNRFVLRSNDELRMLLDDNLLQLQSMLSSRFAATVIEKIKKWEKSLNVIREVLDAWLQVPRIRLLRMSGNLVTGGLMAYQTL